MPIARLADTDLDTFAAESADPGALWLFLHIPKTAGSSLSAELNARVPPYRNVHLEERHYRRTDLTGHAFWAQLDEAIASLIADDATTGFRSASGHMLAAQAEKIRYAIPRTRLVTFVRDPVARVVSDDRYQRSPQHPAHEEFAARHPRLADYVEAAERNKVYAHLALYDGEPVPTLLERVGRTFAFVGAVEFYEMSFDILMRLAGVSGAVPEHYERAGDAAGEEPDAAMSAAIVERNRRDAAIFDHFHALLARHHAAWLAGR
jgi:hypothetical protein